MLKSLQDKLGNMILGIIMVLTATILPKGLGTVMRGNKNSKENLRCLLVKSPSKKECTRMMKFTIENKNNEEESSKRNNEGLNKKIREAIKSLVRRDKTRMRLCGIKFFQNKSLDQLQKNNLHAINQHTAK